MSSMPSLSPAYNDFLYATVYEERNEMQLSVISALARLGLDPWTEAANLAGMTGDGAASRLSGLLAGVVDSHEAGIDRAAIATRLVTLLPQAPQQNRASKSGWLATGVEKRGRARFSALGMLCLALLLAAGVSFVMTTLAPGQGGGRQDGRGAVSTSGAPSPSPPSGSSTPRPPR